MQGRPRTPNKAQPDEPRTRLQRHARPASLQRLNVFQRVMLQWSDLHPYNAGQAAKVAGSMRPQALRNAVNEACAANGLGTVRLDPKGRHYEYLPVDQQDLTILRAENGLESALADHITAELNRPFARPECQPLRFFAIDGGDTNDAHYVGVIYDHWVADSVAIRLVLRHVLGRYCGFSVARNGHPLDLYPDTYRRTFRKHWSGGQIARGVLSTVGLLARLRRAYRVSYLRTAQLRAQFEVFPTAPGTVERLHAFSKSVGVSVHDVFLAALARGMAEFMPSRSRHGKRRNLALGTIVDTRGVSCDDLAEAMGMYLAYYVVQCEPRRRARLADLAARIGTETRRIKARRRYLDTLVNMKMGTYVWPLLPDRAKPHFFRQTLTLSAGISNVTLRDTWLETDARQHILDHVRIAPTGPLLPLVLTPTTLNGHLNIGITYRTSGFPRRKLTALMQTFLYLIENPT